MSASHFLKYVVLAFIAGVFVSSFVQIPSEILGTTAVVLFLCMALTVGPKRRAIFLTACIALFSVIGAWRMSGIKGSGTFNLKVPDPFIWMTGAIVQDPIFDGNTQRFVLSVQKEKILITAQPYPRYAYGDTLKVSGILRVPYNTPDGQFDYRAYLARDGIYTIMIYPEIEYTRISQSFLRRAAVTCLRAIYAVRDAFLASINRAVPEPHAAFIAGILVGTRSQLPEDVKENFARTSISHVAAVSGYNITIIASALGALLILFMKRSHAFWFTIVGLFIFVIITGAQASVVRATIMGILALSARYVGRLATPSHILILTAGSMIAINPAILRYDIGFQLSFLSTAGILFISPLIEDRVPFARKLGVVGETFIMTLSAQLCVVPLLIYYFKMVSLISLPVNVVILPFIPLAMLLGFATGVAGLIMPLFGSIVGYFAWAVSAGILGVVRAAARLSWAAITVELAWYWIAAIYVCMALLYRRVAYPHKS